MKKSTKLTSILLMAATLTLAACQMPEPEEPQFVNPLPGTSWNNVENDTYEDENGEMQQSLEIRTIRFETDSTGTLTDQFISPSENEVQTLPFRYTYTDTHGTITITDGTDSETFRYQHDGQNNRLTLYGDEGERMVFNKMGN